MRTLATLTFINLIRLSVIIFLLMVGRWVPGQVEKKMDFKWLIPVMYLEFDSSRGFADLVPHLQPSQLNF